MEQDNRKMLYILATGYMVSRCLSGIGVITLPKANASGTVAEFSRKAQDTRVRNILIIYLVLLTGFMFWIQPVWGNSSNRDGPACILVLPAQGSEIFWWDDRRSFWIFPVSL